MNKNAHTLKHIFLVFIFIMAAVSKIKNPASTESYIASVGLLGILLWPTITLKLLGGITMIIGFKVHVAAIALTVFTVVAAMLIHNIMANKMQSIVFFRDISIAGGFILLAASGTSAFSVAKN